MQITDHDMSLPSMDVIDELQSELSHANAMLAILLTSDFIKEVPEVLRDYLKRVDDLIFKSKALSLQLT